MKSCKFCLTATIKMGSISFFFLNVCLKLIFMFISYEKIWKCKFMFILVLVYFYRLFCWESTNYSVSHQFKTLVISLKFIFQGTFKPFWFKCSLPLRWCYYFISELSIIKFSFFPYFWKLFIIINCFYSYEAVHVKWTWSSLIASSSSGGKLFHSGSNAFTWLHIGCKT